MNSTHGGYPTMIDNIEDQVNKAIKEHFELPPDIRKLANQATYSLYNGPIQDDDGWPGFTQACALVGGWCDDNLHEVWYDIQSGEVLDYEPEYYEDDDGAWVEPEWEDYYHCERDAVKRATFGRVLAAYI